MKKIKFVRSLLALLFLVVPTISFAQQFQSLIDIDSSYDWAFNNFLLPDSNYIIFGEFVNPNTSQQSLFNSIVSASSKTIIVKKILSGPLGSNLYPGSPNQVRKIPGGYVGPLTITYHNDSIASAGIVKYSSNGDTMFTKTFTDTSLYFETANACNVLPTGGYLIGGYSDLDTPSYYPAYLVKTDTNGNVLWRHKYSKYPSQWAFINNIIPLADGRIVVAAMTTEEVVLGPLDYFAYYYNRPWFMILDSSGSIIRDTVFTNGYMVSGGLNTATGNMYADANGGFIQVGSYDSLITTDPSDLVNFPGYLAHLDSNFRVTWIISFPYNDNGHRQPMHVKQLADNSYVVLGDNWDVYGCGNWGWVTKSSASGVTEWDHIYYSDSVNCDYLYSLLELADGALLLSGSGMNDTLPRWHTSSDIWLVGLDSNGCMQPGCNTGVDTVTSAGNIVRPSSQLSVFPNPTQGNIAIQATTSGSLALYDIVGQKIAEYGINAGLTQISLSRAIDNGVYVGVYRSAYRNTAVVRILLQR